MINPNNMLPYLIGLSKRRVKEDLSAAFPHVQFRISKSTRERSITILWCGDPSEAEVAAITKNHEHDGIQYQLHRYEQCALCGSTQFVQWEEGRHTTSNLRALVAIPTSAGFPPQTGK